MKQFEYELEIDNDEDTVLMKVRIEYRYDYEDELLEIDNVYSYQESVGWWMPLPYSDWKEFQESIEDKINCLEDKARRDESETNYIESVAGDWS